MQSPAEAMALYQHGHNGGAPAHGAENHAAPPADVPGAPRRNEFRVIRGTDTKIVTDENGNKKVEYLNRTINNEAVAVPYSNFWDNYVQRFVQLRERDGVMYDRIISRMDPTEAAMVERLMTEVPDAHGNAKRWEVNKKVLSEFLNSDDGLKVTSMVVGRETFLMAAAQGKFQKQEFDLRRMETMTKLKNSPDAWNAINDPNIKEYLKEVWEIDLDDYRRNTNLANFTDRFHWTGRGIRVLPNVPKQTAGINELFDALGQAGDARELYYRQTLGYTGKLPASPISELITFGRSHGLKGLKGVPDGEIEARIMREFNSNDGGILDRAGHTLEINPGIRNPDFDNTRIDAVGNIRRYLQAESRVMAEYYKGFLQEEDLNRQAKELQEKKAAVNTRAEAGPNDPALAKRQAEAAEKKGKLQAELEGITTEDQAFAAYRSQTEAMNVASAALRGAGVPVEDGVQFTDVDNAVIAKKSQLGKDLATKKSALNTNLHATIDPIEDALNDNTTTPPGARATYERIKSKVDIAEARYRSKGLDEKSALSAARNEVNTDEPGSIVEMDNAFRTAQKEEERIANLKKEYDDEVKRLDAENEQQNTRLDELQNQYKEAAIGHDGQGGRKSIEKGIIDRAPRGELLKMEGAYGELITGGISEDDLSNMSVAELVKRIKPGKAPFTHLKGIKPEDLRELVTRAKAEQLALNEEVYITTPTSHEKMFDEIVTGSARPAPLSGNPLLTPDDLVTLNESELRRRLEVDYGWDPSAQLTNWDAMMRAREAARQRLVIRTAKLADVKKADIQAQIAEQDKTLQEEPGKRAKEAHERLVAIDKFCERQQQMMQDSEQLIEHIGEYTDTGAIDRNDPNFTTLEKKHTAPKGYYKMLEYFGYNRHNPNMEERNAQLEEMERVLSPMQLSELLYDNLPQIQARVNALGHRGEIDATLQALNDRVGSHDVEPENFRTAVRKILSQLLDEAVNAE